MEVLWSPNKDEDFATYSNELKLYTFKVNRSLKIIHVHMQCLYIDPIGSSCDVIRAGVCIYISPSALCACA